MQSSRKDLENFLKKWIQEAETTVNVLADASPAGECSLQDTVWPEAHTADAGKCMGNCAFYFNFAILF